MSHPNQGDGIVMWK